MSETIFFDGNDYVHLRLQGLSYGEFHVVGDKELLESNEVFQACCYMLIDDNWEKLAVVNTGILGTWNSFCKLVERLGYPDMRLIQLEKGELRGYSQEYIITDECVERKLCHDYYKATKKKGGKPKRF